MKPENLNIHEFSKAPPNEQLILRKVGLDISGNRIQESKPDLFRGVCLQTMIVDGLDDVNAGGDADVQ